MLLYLIGNPKRGGLTLMENLMGRRMENILLLHFTREKTRFWSQNWVPILSGLKIQLYLY